MAAPVAPAPRVTTPAVVTRCALDLITDALRELEVLSAIQTPSGPDAALGLTRLNALLGTWATQRLTIAGSVRQVFPLAANKATYTMGPGAADWNIPRALTIQNAGVINTTANNVETPLTPLTIDRWAAVGIKGMTTTLPWAFFDDQSVPIGNVTIYPTPTVSTLQIALYIPVALQRFPDLYTQIQFGDGYEAAMVSNLALKLARPFGRPVTPDLMAEAVARLADIKRIYIDKTELTLDPAFTGRPVGGYDIYSDTYRGWRD